MALDYDNITSICKTHYIPMLADNIFNSSYLFKQMRARPDVISGGKDIHQPLLYAKGRSDFYSEWDTIDVSPKETRTAAIFEWKFVYANMTISKQQEDKITGDAAVLNLLQVETETTQKTLTDKLSTALFNDGSDSQRPHGLRHIINYDRSLGGIDSTTYTWWDANIAVDINSNYSTTNLSAANLTNPSSDYFVLTVMRNTWSKCIHNAEHPDAVYMSEGMFNLYEQILQPYAVYNREPSAAVKMAADGGFQVLEWKGVPVIYDEFCPAGFVFFTNSKYLNMKILAKDNFSMGPWQKPVNAMQRMAQITVSLNFVTSNSRYLGRIEAVSTIG